MQALLTECVTTTLGMAGRSTGSMGIGSDLVQNCVRGEPSRQNSV